MKIIVLGSSGQLGRSIADEIDNDTHSFIFYNRNELDITDFKKTNKAIIDTKPDIIINAAAYTNVDQAEVNSKDAHLTNHLAVENLSSISKQINSVLIHISTDYVFDGESCSPYMPTDSTNPQCVYGESKLNGEKSIIKSECKYLIIRTSWIFSKYGKNFLKTMIDLSKSKNEISVINDQYGSPTYAKDLAQALIKIISKLKLSDFKSSIYHYSGREECSWYDFAKVIFDCIESINGSNEMRIIGISSSDYDSFAKRPKYSVLDCDSLIKEFDIETSNWQNGASEVIESLI